jgi:hypothetical protein
MNDIDALYPSMPTDGKHNATQKGRRRAVVMEQAERGSYFWVNRIPCQSEQGKDVLRAIHIAQSLSDTRNKLIH